MTWTGILNNATDDALSLVTFDLSSGDWSAGLPDSIDPNSVVTWKCDKNWLGQVSGSATYRGSRGTLRVAWDVPTFGAPSYGTSTTDQYTCASRSDPDGVDDDGGVLFTTQAPDLVLPDVCIAPNNKQVVMCSTLTLMDRFNAAIIAGDYDAAIRALNGLNMSDMLTSVDSLQPDQNDALFQANLDANGAPRGDVDSLRIEYAFLTVNTRVLSLLVPGDLQATGQVVDAADFIAGKFLPIASGVNPDARPHLKRILLELNRQGIDDKSWIAYALATAHWESGMGKSMVENASGQAYEGRTDLGNTQPGDGVRFKGRGYVQITGRGHYAQFSALVQVDLVADPSRAMATEIASQTMVYGMRTGAFTGVKLATYGTDGTYDFVQARRIINGQDKATTIAQIAQRYRNVMSQ